MSIKGRLAARRGVRGGCTGLLYVVDELSGTLSIIDATTETALKTLSVGDFPSQVMSDPDEEKLFIVANGVITVVSVDEIVGTIPFAGNSGEVRSAYMPGAHRLYLSMKQTNAVNVYDTDTYQLITTIPVGATPLSIAADTTTGKVYVYSYHSSNLSVIDSATNTVVDVISTGAETINDLVVDHASGKIYSATNDGLMIMDESTGAVLNKIDVGGSGLDHIAYDPTLNLIYGTNELWTKGVIIDPDEQTIDEAPLPDYYHGSIAVDSEKGLAYFTNSRDKSITVVDGANRTVVETIPMDGEKPIAIAYACVADELVPAAPYPPMPVDPLPPTQPSGPIEINARVTVCCNVDVNGLFELIFADETGAVAARKTNDAGGHVVFNLPAMPPGEYHYTLYEERGVAGFRQDIRRIPVQVTIDANGEAKVTYPHNKPFFHNVLKVK